MSQRDLETDGMPVRTQPLPLEFPGIHYMGQEEIEAAVRVLSARSPFRYYGIDLQHEVEAFEREFSAFLDIKHALARRNGSQPLSVAVSNTYRLDLCQRSSENVVF